MKTAAAAAAALPFLASLVLAAPAQAVPQPNQITFVCENGKTYEGTAPSQNSVVARFMTLEGPATGSVKAAVGYPSFTGVPLDRLTSCQVLKNGQFFVDGFVLLAGPGSRPAA